MEETDTEGLKVEGPPPVWLSEAAEKP